MGLTFSRKRPKISSFSKGAKIEKIYPLIVRKVYRKKFLASNWHFESVKICVLSRVQCATATHSALVLKRKAVGPLSPWTRDPGG